MIAPPALIAPPVIAADGWSAQASGASHTPADPANSPAPAVHTHSWCYYRLLILKGSGTAVKSASQV